jgi:hypothetical protein
VKFKIILLLVTTTVSYTSCESEQAFSIDGCVGKYVCRVDGQTLMVLPNGRNTAPVPPVTSYPEGVTIHVKRTGESELTLTLDDRIIVAQVNPEGRLTIPDAPVYLENDHFTMSLTASYTSACITSGMLFIKQVATGTASCSDQGDGFTLTVVNTQFFEGKK